jgi:4,5:9,10-diseco-3-hydroxy-5,9,17-trioxoandrosta-1(10),2-diene-4-oate hydrolase
MKILRNIVIVCAALYLLLVLIAFLPSETVPIEQFATQHSSFLEIDGKRIHYTKTGTGPPLVLVHGFGGGQFVWDKVVPFLEDSFTLYALDLLGFGLTDKPIEGCYSMACQAELVLLFIAKLGLPSATIVGHSMGGVIGAYCAIKAPENIDRLVIIEGGFYHGKAPAFLKYLFFPLQKLSARLFYTQSGRRPSLQTSYYRKELVTDAMVEQYLIAAKTPNAINALAAMMKDESAKNYEGISSLVTQPTLLVWSAESKNHPLSDGKRLQREIKKSELIVINQSGHYIQDEQPQELARHIKQFLARE